MKAAVLKQYNEVPVVEDRPVPEAAGNEVIIKQTYTGICYRDILTLRGHFPRVRMPIVPGHEVAGRIAALGSSVEGLRVGDRVSGLIYMPCGECKYCRGGRENLCRNKQTLGESVDGSYAPYVSMTQDSVVRVPDETGDESAVIAACVSGMLIQALRTRARLAEGEKVLVTGAGGGVGAHAVQIAGALGGEVIASTSSAWKEEGIRKLGASEVVQAGNASKAAKKLTGGEGVDVVIDTVGAPTFSESLRSLNFGGRLVIIGNVDASSAELPLGYIILKGLEIIGSVSSTRRDVAEALELSRRGLVRPVIDRKVRLENVGDAYAAMSGRNTFGRVLIDVGGQQ